MRSKSTQTLLNVVENYTAGDVMEFTKSRYAATASGVGKNKSHNVAPSSVIVIDSTMTPLEAATLLWENNIMGAPVYNSETKTYAGMFDIRDILSCVNVAHREFDLLMSGVEYSREPIGKDSNGHNMYRKMQREGLDRALTLLYTTGNVPIPVTVTYIAARNPMSPVFYTNESSLFDICKVLTNRHSHRVCIGASSPLRSVCEAVLSQSDIVAFVASKCSKESLDESIDDAGLHYRKDVVAIADTAKASMAFELMDAKRLSGIAVVNDDGKLVGNVSAKDIKRAVLDPTNIHLDVLSYLAIIRQAEANDTRHPFCHVSSNASVGHVVNMMAKTGFHRVYVVDTDSKPIGVISFSDIIKHVIKPDIARVVI